MNTTTLKTRNKLPKILKIASFFLVGIWLLFPFILNCILHYIHSSVTLSGATKLQILSIYFLYHAPLLFFFGPSSNLFNTENNSFSVTWLGHLVTILFYYETFFLLFLIGKKIIKLHYKEKKKGLHIFYIFWVFFPFFFTRFSSPVIQSKIGLACFIIERIYYFPMALLLDRPFFKRDSEILFVVNWQGYLITFIFYSILFILFLILMNKYEIIKKKKSPDYF